MTNRPLNAIIVDDELLARQYLKRLLSDFEQINVINECANGFEALKAIGEVAPDLLFLDIQMPKLNGFEVLELLDTDVAVVFVTAYDHYAVKAFDANAVDYLLKPFTKDRLKDAIEKVQRNRDAHAATHLKQIAERTELSPTNRIIVKDGSRVTIIPHDQIDYIQAEDDYIAIHTKGKSHLKHQTLANVERTLNAAVFVRIHRSTIVNVEQIERIDLVKKDSYAALLKNGVSLSISRSGHKRLKAILSGA